MAAMPVSQTRVAIRSQLWTRSTVVSVRIVTGES